MKLTFVIALAALAGSAPGQTGNPAVLTGQYDNSRTGANLQESILSPSNVNPTQFGRLTAWTLDGYEYAQPLYVPGVIIQGVAHNTVYVATMHNSIYAFDAALAGSTPLWKATLEPSVPAPSANGCPSQDFTGPELGILGTPVINQATNTLYAITATPASGGFKHFLHAIDIRTGLDTSGSPVQITASAAGTGYANEPTSNGQILLSSANTDVQRTALLLANGSVYAAFGNCGPDNDPWHGWLVGYSASSLQQTAVFNATPSSGQGGIWQSGRGLIADSNGYIYLTTGNGMNDGLASNYAQSLLKLSSSGAVAGNFPPLDIANLNYYDLDFSSSGPLMIPGTNNWLVAGGKAGTIYVFDGNNFGPNTKEQGAKQYFQATQACSSPTDNGCFQIHDIAFANDYLYLWGSNDYLRSFKWNGTGGGLFSTSGFVGTQPGSFHPAALAISGNGSQSNILWALTEASTGDPAPGTLHAYDTLNGTPREIWNSDQNTAGRDKLPSIARWTNPTVANGMVYVPTHSKQLVVYGLLTPSDFSISSASPSQTVVQGKATTYPLSVSSQGGFNSAVTFSVSGQPAEIVPSFNPSSVTGPGTSTLTMTASNSAAPGTYNLILKATGGGRTHTASLTLVVNAATIPDVIPPSWTCCIVTSGPPRQLQYTIQDIGSGLASVTPLTVYGATYSIQSFTPGTLSPVILTVSPKSGGVTYVRFRIKDVAGNSTLLDPLLIEDTRSTGKPNPVSGALKDLQPDEHWMQIFNYGGAKNIRIEINGVKFQEAGLKDGEIRLVDVASALGATLSNTVVVTFLGKPGGAAVISISNLPVPGK